MILISLNHVPYVVNICICLARNILSKCISIRSCFSILSKCVKHSTICCLTCGYKCMSISVICKILCLRSCCYNRISLFNCKCCTCEGN